MLKKLLIDADSEPGVVEKMGCSCGDYSISLIWQTLMYFLPIFYTDTFGLSPAFIAGMFFWVRFIDAITDPLCGILCDRTKSRWGKYRPYLLWFCLPYGVAIVLMFSTPQLSVGGKELYAVITYIGMMLIYTIVSTPNNCITGVISADESQRTGVSTYKFVFAYAAGFTVQLLIIPMVQKLGEGNDAAGYRISMMIFAVIAIVGLLIAFVTVRERVNSPVPDSTVKDDLSDLWSNRPWKILFGMILISLIYIAIRSASIAYYFKYFLESELQMGIFMAVGTAFVIVGVLPSKILSSRFGKIRVVQTCMIIIFLTLVAFFFPRKDDIVLLYVLQIILSIASGPIFPLIWSMLADTCDYSELETGRRATGLIFSAGTFAIKIGFAFGGAVLMWMLGMFGFIANQDQAELSILGIKLGMSVLPAIILLSGILLFSKYDLNEPRLKQIAKELSQARSA